MATAIPKIITNYSDVELLAELLWEQKKFSYDFETLGVMVARLRVAGLGFAYGTSDDECHYIITEHIESPALSWSKCLEILKPVFENEAITQIAHNQLFDAAILDYGGIKLHTNTYDTMVMAWLTNTERKLGLKKLVLDYFDYKMSELTEFCVKERVNWHPDKIIRVDKCDLEQLTAYAADDVKWTYALHEKLTDELEASGISYIYDRIYKPFLRVLTEMQTDGIQTDIAKLQEQEKEVKAELDIVAQELISRRIGQDFDPALLTGNIDVDRKHIPELQEKWKDRETLRPLLYANPYQAHKLFSLGSSQQLNKILFEEFAFEPIGEQGKTGFYSTGKEVIAKLSQIDNTGFIENIIRYKLLIKLHSTYLLGMQEKIDPDGRLRTSYRCTLATGRLSSSNPNLQNIPARTKEGKRIREAFVAREGYSLVVADYSSMEMRIVAQYSQDESLINGFRDGADPHSITAKQVFGLDCDVEEVKKLFPLQRSIGKTLNFSTLYGSGPRTLVEQISKATDGEIIPTVAQAVEYQSQLLARMPGVASYIYDTRTLAKKEGKVNTLTGRFRHVSAALDERHPLHHAALRQAVNSRIQGTAADIIAIAMRNIREVLVEKQLWRQRVWMVLQVHDELVFEVEDELVEDMKVLVKAQMEAAMRLLVPIVAEPESGSNWAEAK